VDRDERNRASNDVRRSPKHRLRSEEHTLTTSPGETGEEPDGLPIRLRILALTATSIATFTSQLDQAIANTALPTIARYFHISAETSIWVVNGYQLAVAATLLMFAALGDTVGPTMMFLGGLALFTLGSLGCALANSFLLLVGMRAVQGIASADLMGVTQPIIRTVYPHRMLGRAIGNNAVFVAVGAAAGPTIGGIILAFAHWQWLFWINVPICTLGLVLGWRYLPRQRGTGAPLDVPSIVLSAFGFASIVYGLDGIARHLPITRMLVFTLLGAIAMALFIVRQRRLRHKLFAVDLFRFRIFSLSAAASTMTYTAQALAYVSLPFYFQSVLGRTPLESGLLLSSWPLTTAIAAPLVGTLSDRYPASLLGTIGISIMASGLALFAFLPTQSWMILGCSAICGTGFGFFQTPNNRAMIASTPRSETGRATGVLASVRVAGQTLGTTLVAIVFGLSGIEIINGNTGSTAHAVIATALWLGCAFCLLAAVASGFRFGASAPVTAS